MNHLDHTCVPRSAGTEGPFSRPGYALAEAAALVFGSNSTAVADSNANKSSFLRILQKKFALWGRREAEELYRPIGSKHYLELIDAAIVEKSSGIHWRDVRFIPEIYAPNIHAFFDELELKEAFQRVVFSDPETRSAFDVASRSAPCLWRLLSDRHLFGPDQMLKIAKTTSLNRVCSRHLNTACAKLAGKKVRLGAYPDLIGRKSTFLLRSLSTGRILSNGFWRSGPPQRIAIDRTLWTREEYAIDLRKGDLVNIESGETEWRSIVLGSPKFEIEADAVARPVPKASASPPTTKPEFIARWLQEKYPERPALQVDQLLEELKRDTSLSVSKSSLERAIPLAWPHN